MAGAPLERRALLEEMAAVVEFLAERLPLAYSIRE